MMDASSVVIAFSGHMGSGKDTIAKIVMESVPRRWFHESFANGLRNEVGDLIAVIGRDLYRGYDEESTVDDVLSGMKGAYDPAPASDVIIRLYREIHSRSTSTDVADIADIADSAVSAISGAPVGVDDGGFRGADMPTPWDRTDLMRYVLQTWGTEVRRSKDPEHWVRIARDAIGSRLSAGASVVVTDARFPNELDMVKSLGGMVVRLEVDDGTQAERIFRRDGTVVTDEMRRHPSETAADHWTGFDVIVDAVHNAGMAQEDVARLVVDSLRAQGAL